MSGSEISGKTEKQKPKAPDIFLKDTVKIIHGNLVVQYVDGENVPETTRRSVLQYARTEAIDDGIIKGSSYGLRFRIFFFLGPAMEKIMGFAGFVEILDNPHGFGKMDLYHTKYFYPEFRGSAIGGFIQTDLQSIIFTSGKANRLYTYVKVGPSPIGTLNQKIVSSDICSNINSSNRLQDLDKFTRMGQMIDIKSDHYGIIEISGPDYLALTGEKVHGS
jgi:hypothetical protein